MAASVKTMTLRLAIAAAIPLVATGAFLIRRDRPAIAKRPIVREMPLPTHRSENAVARLEATIASLPKTPAGERARLNAGVRLGYAHAAKKEWPAARVAFLKVAAHDEPEKTLPLEKKTIGGTWGTSSDQGAYQAAVCLAADGKDAEAVAEFRRFIEERPLSPLVYAAHRRLRRLHGEPLPEDDARLQTAVTRQEKRARYELSVCGPKALAEWARRRGVATDTLAIAKTAKRTDDGTTPEGLSLAMRTLGWSPEALSVARTELSSQPFPALVLLPDHWALALAVKGDSMTVWDPLSATERQVPLPPETDLRATFVFLVDRSASKD